MDYKEVRQELYDTVMKARESGLIRLSAGNISVRTEDGLAAITPSSIKYDVLKPEEIAIVDLEGKLVDGPKKPSSETPMHTTLLKYFPEVGSVCHTHSPYAITFAVAGKEVPVANLELFVCGGAIPVAPWACPGTAENGKVAVDIFQKFPNLKVCLLRNHGLVALGANLEKSYELAYDAEVGMQSYYQALVLGNANTISEEQQEQIRQAYA